MVREQVHAPECNRKGANLNCRLMQIMREHVELILRFKCSKWIILGSATAKNRSKAKGSKDKP